MVFWYWRWFGRSWCVRDDRGYLNACFLSLVPFFCLLLSCLFMCSKERRVTSINFLAYYFLVFSCLWRVLLCEWIGCANLYGNGPLLDFQLLHTHPPITSQMLCSFVYYFTLFLPLPLFFPSKLHLIFSLCKPSNAIFWMSIGSSLHSYFTSDKPSSPIFVSNSQSFWQTVNGHSYVQRLLQAKLWPAPYNPLSKRNEQQKQCIYRSLQCYVKFSEIDLCRNSFGLLDIITMLAPTIARILLCWS